LGLQKIRVEKFRCLDAVEFSPDSGTNLIVGENGAGKTSILEAIFLLGRGRSFRPGQTHGLIQYGSTELTVYGEISSPDERYKLGVQFSRKGREIHINGQAGSQTAALASAFPLQIIDPEVHLLVQGGPQGRRHFVDWGVFHVKHDFLPEWRRFRRALQQRNTALKQKADIKAVKAWDAELIQAGQSVDACRREYLEEFEPILTRISSKMLGTPPKCRYLRGWPSELSFADALEASQARDRQYCVTHVGPHRAELVLEIDGHPARNQLSRGQQKLLGSSMVLAQSEFVAARSEKRVTLLIDEPAAELDEAHLDELLQAFEAPGLQLFLTALREDSLPLKTRPRVFHVKHGILSTLV
jgi:DNA replication and repair protein RecF